MELLITWIGTVKPMCKHLCYLYKYAYKLQNYENIYFSFKIDPNNDMAITIKHVISFLWDLLQP